MTFRQSGSSAFHLSTGLIASCHSRFDDHRRAYPNKASCEQHADGFISFGSKFFEHDCTMSFVDKFLAYFSIFVVGRSAVISRSAPSSLPQRMSFWRQTLSRKAPKWWSEVPASLVRPFGFRRSERSLIRLVASSGLMRRISTTSASPLRSHRGSGKLI
jgi:hypothetical protein